MNKEQILRLIKTLALSQGIYGRLLAEIQADDSILDFITDQNFGSDIDFVMWYEGGC